MLNKFHSPLFNSCFSLINSLLIFCLIFSLSSCTTTSNYTINEPQTIKHDGVIKINTVVMKDSSVYNFKEDQAVYKKKYRGSNEVIILKQGLIEADSTIRKISREKYLILLKDISSIKYKRTYVSTSDALLTGGIIVGSALFIFFTLFYIAFNFGGISMRM